MKTVLLLVTLCLGKSSSVFFNKINGKFSHKIVHANHVHLTSSKSKHMRSFVSSCFVMNNLFTLHTYPGPYPLVGTKQLPRLFPLSHRGKNCCSHCKMAANVAMTSFSVWVLSIPDSESYPLLSRFGFVVRLVSRRLSFHSASPRLYL